MARKIKAFQEIKINYKKGNKLAKTPDQLPFNNTQTFTNLKTIVFH